LVNVCFYLIVATCQKFWRIAHFAGGFLALGSQELILQAAFFISFFEQTDLYLFAFSKA
jgi:hypothetical protein